MPSRRGETKNRLQCGMAGSFNSLLGDDVVLVQKFLQLVGIEIREHFVAGNKGGHVSLVGKRLHLLISLAVEANIDLGEFVTTLSKIVLCVDAPGTPFATKKFDLGRHRGN
jgi:hypothetical protein